MCERAGAVVVGVGVFGANHRADGREQRGEFVHALVCGHPERDFVAALAERACQIKQAKFAAAARSAAGAGEQDFQES